jgi:N6-L-threonylcarbamoyladenine synthase
MIVLGIETSCDETSVGIVELNDTSKGATLYANAVLSSMDLHTKYGGVVPEIAAREHIKAMPIVIEKAFEQAGMSWKDIDAISVTNGAGLGGSLLVGVMTARTLAITQNKPLYACNHVEGHVYANFVTKVSSTFNSQFPISKQNSTAGYQLPQTIPQFPILALIVSGNHTQLVLFKDHFDYRLLGQTHDDAIGEAFDKCAKITGLPYPGGPSIAAKAKEGDTQAFDLPKAKMPGKYDFSFSGVKTATLRQAQAMCGEDFTFPSKNLPERLSEPQKANIAAVFQRVAIETVVDKTALAYEEFGPASVIIAGGVAASTELRRQLSERLPIDINYADIKLCTDNGAMIACLGAYKALLDQPKADPYSLEINPNLSMKPQLNISQPK